MKRIGVLLWLGTGSSIAFAYVLSGNRWPQAETTFVYELINTRGETTSPSGIPWNSAFEASMRHWNERTAFTFYGQAGTFADPCRDDGLNSIAFRRDDCGFAFGSTTLAITYSLFFNDGTLQETDIVFNDNQAWDIYEGPLRSRVTDFTRVATHELGHALGLDHEDRVPAIMSSLVGDLTLPQKDDIEGVAALYGGQNPIPKACQTPTPLPLNVWIPGRLEAADCRRLDIAESAFASDDSALDLYTLDLPVEGLVVVRMDSDQLDPYLEIRQADGNILRSDDDGGAGNDALVVLQLAAGRYQILANSAFRTLQEGDYRLQVSINLSQPTVRLESDWSVTIDSVDVNGIAYWARLVPYANPDDPEGLYWRLDSYAVHGGEPVPGALLLPDSTDLIFNPVEALGNRFDVILRRYFSPPDPAGWYWKMDQVSKRN